ncbi:MAG: hypothetical protein AAGE94_24090 [Acidobacteriota bacterium]
MSDDTPTDPPATPSAADSPTPADDFAAAPAPPEGAAPPPPPQGAPPPPPQGAAPPPPGAAPPPSSGAGGEGPNRRLFLVLSYLWLLALVPFLLEKDDAEVQWHAKHGLVLLIAEVILWIALNIFQWGVGLIVGPLACFGCFAFLAVAVVQIGFHIACIMKALNGERLLVPGISHYADQF